MPDDAVGLGRGGGDIALDQRLDRRVLGARPGLEIGGALGDQAMRRGVEVEPEVAEEIAIFPRAGEQPPAALADIGIMGCPDMTVAIAG